MTALLLAAAVAGFGDRPGLLIDPVNFDRLPLHAARKLDGQTVCVVFTMDSPPFEYRNTTIAGPDSPDASAVRAVHFNGQVAAKLANRQGKTLRVVGVLRVADYPAMATAGMQLDAWSIIRIENATLVP